MSNRIISLYEILLCMVGGGLSLFFIFLLRTFDFHRADGLPSPIALLGVPLLYLAAHFGRAARLSLIAMPTLGLSFRSTFAIHFTVSPLSLILPFKFDEIIRWMVLAHAGHTGERAFIVLLIDRSMDGLALILLFLAVSASGGEAFPLLLLLPAAGLVLVISAFVIVLPLLETAQRYIFLNHRKSIAFISLGIVDRIRRLLVVGRSALIQAFPFVFVFTIGIWALEYTALWLLFNFVSGEASVVVAGEIVDTMLHIASGSWRLLLGLTHEPELAALATFLFFTVLILVWPFAAMILSRRRLLEPMRRCFGGQLKDGHVMSELMLIYDDRAQVPAIIRDIIGADRFCGVLKRQERFVDIIVGAARRSVPQVEFIHLCEDQDLIPLLERIENDHRSAFFMRLPSAFMPTNIREFETVLRKGSFVLANTLLAPVCTDDAPAILARDDMLAVLRAQNVDVRRQTLLRLRDRSDQMIEHCTYADLRRIDEFLNYMIGATETRHFNSAQIEDGIFRKSSTSKDKMRAEHDFYHIANDNLKRFLMPTFDFWEENTKAGYAMEHLAVPDASLQMIHRAFDENSLNRLFDLFFQYINAREGDEIGTDAMRVVAQQQILGKVERRIADFLAQEIGQQVDAIFRKAGSSGGIEKICTRAYGFIREAIHRDGSHRIVISHGDACLPNILFDRRTSLFRLIDPRGATERKEALMHPFYDLAKFSHSILGSYDFINNGLFECRFDEEMRLSLVLDGGGVPEWIRATFRKRLKKEGYDVWVIRAYELSLFLSMLTLHTDFPRKLPAFVLTACNIMDELEILK